MVSKLLIDVYAFLSLLLNLPTKYKVVRTGYQKSQENLAVSSFMNES